MATTSTSPNMSLPVPIVGVDLGPQYAIDINSCLSILDSHDHSSGDGVRISQAGINLTGDLPFNGFNATNLRTTRYASQGAPLAVASDLGCVYVVTNDLYFNDGLGNQIRMTQSGGVAGTPGSIAGLTAPASATYIPASTKFVWQSAVNTSAIMDAGSIIIRNATANSKGVTIAAPAALANDYTMALPAALPAQKSGLSSDSSGNIGVDWSSINDAQNYTLTGTVSANALTIALKTRAGTDATTANQTSIGFRNATATSGSYNTRTITGALSLVVPSGTTIGTTSAVTANIYVYALDNSGTVVLACSLTLFDDKVVQSSSAISGGSSSSTLYSTAAQSNLPIRLLGQITVTEATAGTWATSPSALTLSTKQITTSDIGDSAVTTVKIADSAVTTAKIADSNVTRPKLVAVGQQITGSNGTTGFGNDIVFVNITGLSVTITTTGRPVMLMITPGDANDAYLGVDTTSAGVGTITAHFQFTRAGGALAQYQLSATGGETGSNTLGIRVPPSLMFLDTPSAGTYTYKLQAKVDSNILVWRAIQCSLTAYEL